MEFILTEVHSITLSLSFFLSLTLTLFFVLFSSISFSLSFSFPLSLYLSPSLDLSILLFLFLSLLLYYRKEYLFFSIFSVKKVRLLHELLNKETYLFIDGTLIIDSVKEEDATFYTCKASNPAGTTEKVIRLSVIGMLQTIYTGSACNLSY